jgi:hypothetical protein
MQVTVFSTLLATFQRQNLLDISTRTFKGVELISINLPKEKWKIQDGKLVPTVPTEEK